MVLNLKRLLIYASFLTWFTVVLAHPIAGLDLDLSRLAKWVTGSLETLDKLKDELVSTSSKVFHDPTIKRIITQTSSAINVLEQQAHDKFCTIVSDAQLQEALAQLHHLSTLRDEAWDEVVKHPNAVEVKELFEDLERQTVEAYKRLLEASPAAREVAETVQKGYEKMAELCRDHSTVCVLLAAGLAAGVSEAIISPLWLGFGPQGPIAGSPAAFLQSKLFGAAVPAGGWFSKMQKWGMEGAPGGVGAGVVAGSVAILMGINLFEEWKCG